MCIYIFTRFFDMYRLCLISVREAFEKICWKMHCLEQIVQSIQNSWNPFNGETGTWMLTFSHKESILMKSHTIKAAYFYPLNYSFHFSMKNNCILLPFSLIEDKKSCSLIQQKVKKDKKSQLFCTISTHLPKIVSFKFGG